MTLLEDLEFAADHFEAVSRTMPPISPMNRDAASRAARLRARAARLRAHAARLREEMAYQNDADELTDGHAVLVRINGGRAKP